MYSGFSEGWASSVVWPLLLMQDMGIFVPLLVCSQMKSGLRGNLLGGGAVIRELAIFPIKMNKVMEPDDLSKQVLPVNTR